ncbi:hypothetical protein ACIPUG_13110 [Pectobacterium sp. CHL-2024]|uniref:hypothetical protein n=1 Tax=Pectobacterium sp. CHL-2024 TaxID=3377079 RepID=UPI0037F51A8A
MTDDYFEFLGSYAMDSFNLTVNTDNDFDQLTKQENATLVHEYIHFIQSVSTVYGWYTIGNLPILTQHIVNAIYNKDNSKERNFPYLKIGGEDDQVIENLTTLHQLLEGDLGCSGEHQELNSKSSFYIVDDVVSCSLSESEWFDEDYMELPNGVKYSKGVKVVYRFDPENIGLKNSKKINVMLGAVCLYEFMAYSIEKHILEEKINSPKVPYLVVKDVSEFMLGMEINDNVLSSICEFSLQSRSPGETFYETLKNLKKERIDFNLLTTDIINTCFKEEYIIEVGGNKESYDKIGLLNKFSDEALQEYKQIFSGLDDYIGITNLIYHIQERIKEYRDGNPLMISELLFMNPSDAVVEITKMMNEIAIPPIFNNNGYIGNSVSGGEYNEYFMFFPMLSEFVEIIRKGKSSCSLYSTCSVCSPEAISDNCLSNVYLKGRESMLCGVGQMIKMWKLNDFDFKI